LRYETDPPLGAARSTSTLLTSTPSFDARSVASARGARLPSAPGSVHGALNGALVSVPSSTQLPVEQFELALSQAKNWTFARSVSGLEAVIVNGSASLPLTYGPGWESETVGAPFSAPRAAATAGGG